MFICSFDRIKHKKTDWDKIHKKYVTKFELRVKEAKKAKGIRAHEHSEEAFNEYLRWFLQNTRVQLFPEAYPEDILEEPLVFDELGTLAYNKLVREGRQTSFAPVLNFVVRWVRSYVSIRTEIIYFLPWSTQLCSFTFMTAHGDPEAGRRMRGRFAVPTR